MGVDRRLQLGDDRPVADRLVQGAERGRQPEGPVQALGRLEGRPLRAVDGPQQLPQLVVALLVGEGGAAPEGRQVEERVGGAGVGPGEDQPARRAPGPSGAVREPC